MSFSQRDIIQGFSRHASDYDRHAQLQNSVLANALQMLKPFFEPEMALLDAGCGTGFLLELLHHSDLPFHVYGCDISPGMCHEAQARQSQEHPQHIACGNMEALPFASASMHMALSSLTMQWLNRSQAGFTELYRVLKPGGRCLVTTFGPMTLQELRAAFAQVDDAPHVSTFPAIAALQALAEKSGFQVENAQTEFRSHYYESVRGLMHEIRAIGAANRLADRRRAFTGRHRFAGMERAYREAHETERGIPASWEVLYLLLQKPRSD